MGYDDDGNAVWKVSHLLDERTNPVTGETEFKVRWEGYDPSEDSWSLNQTSLTKHSSLTTEHDSMFQHTDSYGRDVRF